EIDDRARTFRVVARAGSDDLALPLEPVPFSQDELERRMLDFEILSDIPAEVKGNTPRNRLMLGSGMRSWLRVPVRMAGEVRAGIGFAHREPYRYVPEDAEVARRLADRIALVLSHQRLAEEARIAAEARERAARLEATVETLTRELQSRGRGRVIGVSR